jgi:hypothetical protein
MMKTVRDASFRRHGKFMNDEDMAMDVSPIEEFQQ